MDRILYIPKKPVSQREVSIQSERQHAKPKRNPAEFDY